MFILLHLKDTVRIQPSDLAALEKDLMGTIRSELNTKYSNKVIPNQGLVIAVHSILSHNAPQIYAGDGAAYIRTNFRLIVFQPYESEIIVGKVKQSTKDGVLVSLNFFDHIFIPAKNLPQPCAFEDGVWVWKFNDNDYFIDAGLPIRFRVSEIVFAPFNAKISKTTAALSSPEGRAQQHGYLLSPTHDAPVDVVAEEQNGYVVPMKIEASIAETGLGLLDWW